MDREPINSKELLLRIQLLEARQKSTLIDLENETAGLAQSFHPLNLFKSSLKKATTFEGIIDLVEGSLMGAGSGFVAGKVFGPQKGYPIRRMLTSAVILGLGNLVMKNPAAVSSGMGIVMNLFKKITGKNDDAGDEKE